jgi:hypothetical protein
MSNCNREGKYHRPCILNDNNQIVISKECIQCIKGNEQVGAETPIKAGRLIIIMNDERKFNQFWCAITGRFGSNLFISPSEMPNRIVTNKDLSERDFAVLRNYVSGWIDGASIWNKDK